ncbi:MAG: hydrogenase expression/formation protein HypE [Candidatus Eisenbacteria bacterium]|nr:hydrogenase expression/formation protein HypE [Candidatus Eisenbacteria bacterium]
MERQTRKREGKSAGFITLAHGSGGKAAHELITRFFLPYFDNPILRAMDDQGVFETEKGRLALTTDTYVVDPLFFRGGDIGRLAICGTVNDLAVCGARPLYLSAGFVMEEGFPLEKLDRILSSMKEAAEEAGVAVITADTKVVERGACDGLFINTSGVGVVPAGVEISSRFVESGDAVLVSGAIGEHGIAIISEREGISFETDVASDCAPLSEMVGAILARGLRPHAMRDPTRGGLATTLNEIAMASGVEIEIEETLVPVTVPVKSACDLLGFDPLYVANEGKLVAFVPESEAHETLDVMRRNKYGKNAAMIGRVVSRGEPRVYMKTRIGGRRFVDMLVGEQFPRIC